MIIYLLDFIVLMNCNQMVNALILLLAISMNVLVLYQARRIMIGHLRSKGEQSEFT